VRQTLPPNVPRQFEIWWTSMLDPVGRRPVLLLGRTAAFAYLTRVLAVEVTTTIRGIPQEVLLGKREGLSRRCVANLDAMRTVPRESLVSRVGALSTSRHVEVKRALGHVLHWPEVSGL
jgi:mRNA-degrading endonuclease toxin of MazEF toxin-antitoxin module